MVHVNIPNGTFTTGYHEDGTTSWCVVPISGTGILWLHVNIPNGTFTTGYHEDGTTLWCVVQISGTGILWFMLIYPMVHLLPVTMKMVQLYGV